MGVRYAAYRLVGGSGAFGAAGCSGLGGYPVGRRRILFWKKSRQTMIKASWMMWPDILEWP
jgi:hypothetical protein